MDKKLLYDFFEGTTSFEEEEKIKAWLEASPQHKQQFLKERKLFDAMIVLANPENKRTISNSQNGNFYKVISYLYKIAAVFIFLYGGISLYKTIQKEPQVTAMQTITVPPSQRVNISLPDGTNIWLNARSTLRYPISFDKNERKVFLDGEAYFDVAKNGGNKFIVSTDKGDIEVLGTSFNVEAYAENERFETSLFEGSVVVNSRTATPQSIQLVPHQKVKLVDGKLQVEEIIDYGKFSWREGLIDFKNTSFAAIMKEFEKCYGVKIIIENTQIEERVLSGKFRQSDGIDYALRVLQKDMQFNFQRDDESYIFYIK